MDVYRITVDPYSEDLSGTGAALAGGRWNRPGTSVLYTSSSRALATLEVLVHVPVMYIPKNYYLITIRIPEDSLQTVPQEELPTNWNERLAPFELKIITENWVIENRFLVLKVPSAVVAGDFNFLINPHHPRITEVQIIDKQPYRFDTRLTR